jgi:hypothetical protein
MIKSVAVTVADTATLLVTSLYGKAGSSGSVVVNNPAGAGQSVYVGGSDVTTSTGAEIVAGTSISFDLMAGEKAYGIVAATTQAVRVITSGV